MKGEPFGTISKSQAKSQKPISMDYSLQLQFGIEPFYDRKGHTMGGYFTFRDDTALPASEAGPPKVPPAAP